jgi:hypothetical protein
LNQHAGKLHRHEVEVLSCFASSVELHIRSEGLNTELRYRLCLPSPTSAPSHRVVFAGTVSIEDLSLLGRALRHGRCFLPASLGLSDLRDPDLPAERRIEPGWHELVAVGFSLARPTEKRPVRDFLRQVEPAASTWMNLPGPAWEMSRRGGSRAAASG